MNDKGINYAGRLRIILIAVILLNLVHAVIHIGSYRKSITYHERTLVTIGVNTLRSFEGGRRAFMGNRFAGTERLTRFAQTIAANGAILNMVLYTPDGEVLINPYPERTPELRTDIKDINSFNTDQGMVMYSNFNIMHPRRGMMHGRPSQENMKEVIAALVIDDTPLRDAKKQMYTGLVQILLIMALLVAAYLFAIRFIKLNTKQTERLKSAEQEAEMGRMSQVLAHEIKNPLSTISGLVDYAKGKVGDESISDVLSRSSSEIKRLNTIVNDFLTYGRELYINKKETDMLSLAEKSAVLLEMDASNRDVFIDVKGVNTKINADPDRMLQVLFNLLHNAVHASPEGSVVNLEIYEQKLCITNETDGSEIDKNKLFEPFYTTKTRGSGLGLAVVKRICSLHGFGVKVTHISPFRVEIDFGEGS
ncbi:ATP-binding protein [Limisalsivibrio acetivorans]|uniref:ATP-binding protein n=1 Tax=Limisalsivibrio acetivorans TaxID=1304888 RepID=UPI0003B409DD|nr:ATP-binding protein [Limisalsivibrio acetivorans]